MVFIAGIFARGGSKGVPGKNTALIGNRSLLGLAIECAATLDDIGTVFVSTDSEEIASEARRCGAEIPFIRPEGLSADESPEWLAWRHAIENLSLDTGEVEGLIIVPTTSPLRNSCDLQRCIEEFRTGKWDVVITITESQRNPYFNIVTIGNEGNAQLFIEPSGVVSRRQDAPTCYDICTVAYVVSPRYVLDEAGLFAGRVGYILVPPERSLDVDTEFDLEMARAIVNWRIVDNSSPRGLD
jgi:N-acylneuraminate cytidylyltransferase